MAFRNLHTCEMLRNCWAGVGIGDNDIHAPHKTGVRLRLASIDAAKSQSWKKNASFALWETNSFCRATRNYMQFCNRMCLLVTGTWRRRDLLVSGRVGFKLTKNSCLATRFAFLIGHNPGLRYLEASQTRR